MSQKYGIPLFNPVKISGGLSITIPLTVTAILPPDEMRELLEQQLGKQQWKDTRGNLVKELGGGFGLRLNKERTEAVIVKSDTSSNKINDEVLTKLTQLAKREVGRLLAEVYKEAIIARAKLLGTIESMQESKTAMGSRLSITVKV